MPPTRTTRRLEAAKRQIMGALNENAEVITENGQVPSSLSGSGSNVIKKYSPTDNTHRGTHFVSKDLDGSNPDHVRLLLDDIEKGVRQKQELIATIADKANQEQQELIFLGTMKLEKSIRKMTIRDFNHTYDGGDILSIIKDVVQKGDVSKVNRCFLSSAGMKRVRTDGSNPQQQQNHPRLPLSTTMRGKYGTATDLITPAREEEDGKKLKTPATAVRTVRRGEAVFSVNGSPVDHTEEGDLVATVSKKRRGNDPTGALSKSAAFDINVGDGRYINLADPGTMKNLDQNMKDTALSQLKILQDQMASLMAQLGKGNNK